MFGLKPLGPPGELTLSSTWVAVGHAPNGEYRGTQVRRSGRGAHGDGGVCPLFDHVAQRVRAAPDEGNESKGTIDDAGKYQIPTMTQTVMGCFVLDHRIEPRLVELGHETTGNDDLWLATWHSYRDERLDWHNDEFELTFVDMLPEPWFDSSPPSTSSGVHDSAGREYRQCNGEHRCCPPDWFLAPCEATEHIPADRGETIEVRAFEHGRECSENESDVHRRRTKRERKSSDARPFRRRTVPSSIRDHSRKRK